MPTIYQNSSAANKERYDLLEKLSNMADSDLTYENLSPK
jgi:hypothetical protein